MPTLAETNTNTLLPLAPGQACSRKFFRLALSALLATLPLPRRRLAISRSAKRILTSGLAELAFRIKITFNFLCAAEQQIGDSRVDQAGMKTLQGIKPLHFDRGKRLQTSKAFCFAPRQRGPWPRADVISGTGGLNSKLGLRTARCGRRHQGFHHAGQLPHWDPEKQNSHSPLKPGPRQKEGKLRPAGCKIKNPPRSLSSQPQLDHELQGKPK